MKYNIAVTLSYQVNEPGSLLLNIQPEITTSQSILSEEITVGPNLNYQEINLKNNSRSLQFNIAHQGPLTINYVAHVEKQDIDLIANEALISPGTTPSETIPFLFPSRYCPSDRVIKLAKHIFGNEKNAYHTVANITDWIYDHISYTSGVTDAHSSALDVLISRQGVCRDFAHLAILFCRALGIPARYYTAYAYGLDPPDFHACFEAWIGSQWVLFDATRLAPLDGMIRIATGLDAADTSFANIYGDIQFISMSVSCLSTAT